jgi:hypothetical protein
MRYTEPPLIRTAVNPLEVLQGHGVKPERVVLHLQIYSEFGEEIGKLEKRLLKVFSEPELNRISKAYDSLRDLGYHPRLTKKGALGFRCVTCPQNLPEGSPRVCSREESAQRVEELRRRLRYFGK